MSPALNQPDTVKRRKPSAPRARDGRNGRPGPNTSFCRRPRWPAIVFGLFGAAAGWFLVVEIGETLVAQVCYRHDGASSASSVPHWLTPVVGAVTACAVLIGIVGAGIAWRNWRIARKTDPGATLYALDTGGGRQRFLAKAGLLLSLLFLIGIVAAGLAVLLVSPCSAWWWSA